VQVLAIEGRHRAHEGAGAQVAHRVAGKVAVVARVVGHGHEALPDGRRGGLAHGDDQPEAVVGALAVPVDRAGYDGAVVLGGRPAPALERPAALEVDDDLLVNGRAVGHGGQEDVLGGAVAARARAGREARAGVQRPATLGADDLVAAVHRQAILLGSPLGIQRERRRVARERHGQRAVHVHFAVGPDLDRGHVGEAFAGAVGLRVPAAEAIAVYRELVGVQLHGQIVAEALVGHARGRGVVGTRRLVRVEAHGDVLGHPHGPEDQVRRHREARHLGKVDLAVDRARAGKVAVELLPATEHVVAVVRRQAAGEGGYRSALNGPERARALDILGEGAVLALQVVDREGIGPLRQEHVVLALDLHVAHLVHRQAQLALLAALALVVHVPAHEVLALGRRHDNGVVIGLAAVPHGLAVGAAHGAHGPIARGEGHGHAVGLPHGVEVDRLAAPVVQVAHEALRGGARQVDVGGVLDDPSSPVVALALEAVGHVHGLAVVHRHGQRQVGARVLVGVPHVAAELHGVGDGRPVRVERHVGRAHGKACAEVIGLGARRAGGPAVEAVAVAGHVPCICGPGQREGFVFHVQRAGRRARHVAVRVIGVVGVIGNRVADHLPHGVQRNRGALDVGKRRGDGLVALVDDGRGARRGVPALEAVARALEAIAARQRERLAVSGQLHRRLRRARVHRAHVVLDVIGDGNQVGIPRGARKPHRVGVLRGRERDVAAHQVAGAVVPAVELVAGRGLGRRAVRLAVARVHRLAVGLHRAHAGLHDVVQHGVARREPCVQADGAHGDVRVGGAGVSGCGDLREGVQVGARSHLVVALVALVEVVAVVPAQEQVAHLLRVARGNDHVVPGHIVPRCHVRALVGVVDHRVETLRPARVERHVLLERRDGVARCERDRARLGKRPAVETPAGARDRSRAAHGVDRAAVGCHGEGLRVLESRVALHPRARNRAVGGLERVGHGHVALPLGG